MKNLDGTETLTLVVSGEFADKVTDMAESKSISITKVMVNATENHNQLLDALMDAKIQVEALNNFLLESGTVNANAIQVINKINNAIKKATE